VSQPEKIGDQRSDVRGQRSEVKGQKSDCAPTEGASACVALPPSLHYGGQVGQRLDSSSGQAEVSVRRWSVRLSSAKDLEVYKKAEIRRQRSDVPPTYKSLPPSLRPGRRLDSLSGQVGQRLDSSSGQAEVRAWDWILQKIWTMKNSRANWASREQSIPSSPFAVRSGLQYGSSYCSELCACNTDRRRDCKVCEVVSWVLSSDGSAETREALL